VFKRYWRPRILLLVSVLYFASCVDESQYNIQQVQLSPTIAFPVAFADMGIVDMLSSSDSAYIRAYPDSLLYLYYPSTLRSAVIRDLFDLPDNNNSNLFNLPPGTLNASTSNTVVGTINREIDLGLAPALLTEILMRGGDLNHGITIDKATTPANLPLEATISLPDIVHKTTLQPLTIVASNTATSISLKDYVFHLFNNRFNVQIDLVIKPHPTTSIAPNTKADVQLGFDNMEFDYVKGFFGDRTVPLEPQSIDISVFQKLLKGTSVSFVDPKLTMKVVDDMVVPCELNFTVLRATKGVSSQTIQITPSSPINLSVPNTLGMSATTNLTVTNQQNVMSFGPEKLEYSATARINKGLSSGTNIMSDTSRLRITLDTEIPLYGKLNGITVSDTLAIDLSDLKEADVESSSLKISAQNEMPLDARIQIYFLDDGHSVVDSLFTTNQTYLVKASMLTPVGDLQSAGITDLKFSLDPSKLNRLFNTPYLLVKATLATAKDSNGAYLNVKFRASYRLKLNIGLLAKLHVKVQ